MYFYKNDDSVINALECARSNQMNSKLNEVALDKRRRKVSQWCCDCTHRSCDEEVYCFHKEKEAYEIMMNHEKGSIECSFYEQENDEEE